VVTLWIGDFRTKQLQNIYKAAQQTAEYYFLLEDFAEQSWFINNAVRQLPSLELENANVIVALGFNDCVYSCAWSAFKINKIAEQYSKTINELIKEYPDFNFYICSVNPINADYPFAESKNGVITQKQLTEKIELFNTTIKKESKATYIDSYSYLTDTNFETRDGIRHTPDTCIALHNYIKANLKYGTTTAFSPRISAPDPEVDTYLYWTHTSNGGESPFTEKNTTSGSTLPSSTAYAWGRFYEIIGEPPKLSTGEATSWYNYKTDGYKRGDTPKVGAIACWASSDGGYVAVVEQVKSDGSVITSESAWDGNGLWRLFDRTKGTNGNWGMSSVYTFQGFIYCPQTVSVSKEELCTKNSYNITVEEMKPNARYVYQYLSTRGWTLNAIAGLLGNLQEESKMSPASWESTISGSTMNADGTQSLNMTAINSFYSSHRRYPGCGLVQWTPYSKFTEWCVARDLNYWDIDSQLQRIDYEVEEKLQWQARPSKGYDLTFNEFIASTRDAAWLAAAFAFCYERPGRSTGTLAEQNALRAERGTNGDFWYSYLSSLPMEMSDEAPSISGFKVDECLATQASVSFLTHNSNTAKYSLLKEDNVIDSKTFNLKNGYKAITLKNLIPNTKYVLKLEAQIENENNLVRELSFTTLQDYPTNADSVKLSVSDTIPRSPDSFFTLKITKPEYLGYWQAKSGYDVYLIVNGNKVKTLTIDRADRDISLIEFDLKQKFGYKCAMGDIIQVGVHVWVKANKENKLYAKSEPIMSKSICLLNKPVTAYLNK
jgi:surface antigen